MVIKAQRFSPYKGGAAFLFTPHPRKEPGLQTCGAGCTKINFFSIVKGNSMPGSETSKGQRSTTSTFMERQSDEIALSTGHASNLRKRIDEHN